LSNILRFEKRFGQRPANEIGHVHQAEQVYQVQKRPIRQEATCCRTNM